MTDPSPEQPKLTPANQNPWYILMTLHGEQPEGAGALRMDEALHAKNRREWNKFVANLLTPEWRATLLAMKETGGASRYSEDELTPLDVAEQARFSRIFHERCQSLEITPTIPTFEYGILDLSRTLFNKPFSVDGFIFPFPISFSHSHFTFDIHFFNSTFLYPAFFYSISFSHISLFENSTFFSLAGFNSSVFRILLASNA